MFTLRKIDSNHIEVKVEINNTTIDLGFFDTQEALNLADELFHTSTELNEFVIESQKNRAALLDKKDKKDRCFDFNQDDLLLIVEARVRYWEDAKVNGVEDTNGDLIPCKLSNSDVWRPVINITTGRITNWPSSSTSTYASIHYKVCDAGQYWLIQDGGEIAKYKGYYVPSFLCPGDSSGYGDYIIFDVDENGYIQGWKKPDLDPEDWKIQ